MLSAGQTEMEGSTDKYLERLSKIRKRGLTFQKQRHSYPWAVHGIAVPLLFFSNN